MFAGRDVSSNTLAYFLTGFSNKAVLFPFCVFAFSPAMALPPAATHPDKKRPTINTENNHLFFICSSSSITEYGYDLIPLSEACQENAQ
jgi:hypothetical protein